MQVRARSCCLPQRFRLPPIETHGQFRVAVLIVLKGIVVALRGYPAAYLLFEWFAGLELDNVSDHSAGDMHRVRPRPASAHEVKWYLALLVCQSTRGRSLAASAG